MFFDAGSSDVYADGSNRDLRLPRLSRDGSRGGFLSSHGELPVESCRTVHFLSISQRDTERRPRFKRTRHALASKGGRRLLGPSSRIKQPLKFTDHSANTVLERQVEDDQMDNPR